MTNDKIMARMGKLEAVERWPSAAARDQHSSFAERRMFEKHAIAPSAARLCSAARQIQEALSNIGVIFS
jgi:hypothetical protein